MVVFLLSYLLCLGALITLYVYTQRQGRSLGLKTDGDRHHYFWTYGPTAGMGNFDEKMKDFYCL